MRTEIVECWWIRHLHTKYKLRDEVKIQLQCLRVVDSNDGVEDGAKWDQEGGEDS